MGVEYRHFLIVDDPAWTPHADTAARVDAVLRRWLLVDKVEQCLDLTGGALNPIDAADLSSIKAGAGVAVVYAGIAGEPVMRIAGASLYNDIDPRDRYTMRTSLVLGDDFRIPWSSDGVWFELISPPTIAGQPIAANESDDEPGPDLLYERSFPSEGASPPVVKVHVQDGAKENIAWDHIQGYWRAALVIDFGKDLPSFCGGIQALPARDFVTDMADAFRSRLVEIGEFY
ncbi:hypothetical protein FHW83_000543 [Duganella sp. SG902]|uniref:hypothetical protein n=1 Tax=Duganella sp. SG902 TaxID=2587016 RepID=UPI00159EB4E2|nr:hypothetical protein [Duganella sp. SG902]NVM74783.1 hypothetical protein [Duganella sp. SG902]